MARPAHTHDARGMRGPTTPLRTTREPDNELYDRGCDLVEAAAAIRRAAACPGAGRAVPAVLGCVETALQELLWASAVLEQTTHDLTAQSNPRTRLVRERMHRGYANLQQALCDAQRASGAARSLAGRALSASAASEIER
jgi:hypothetical protein